MGRSFVIAIDGPAASGKSTTAKILAEELECLYIDTGAMYRACALYALEHDVDLDDFNSVETMLDKINIRFENIKGQNCIFLNNHEVTDKIRTPEITQKSSRIATIACVRRRMVFLQRKMAENNNVVMDGRDIGTVVFPDADFKFYLIASLETRAKRRLLELKQKGIVADLDELTEELAWRDINDSTRDIAPLTKADDAIEVNTTNMSIDGQVKFILRRISDEIAQYL
ncbi:MAG TPA: (d)CMP kinase [Candidatus Cloacimonadota bacterium]|jgi:cytidylate kinase|nr:(d)CMP kinase [Candidatus Cloacimonadota bacterium]HOD54476.1 (d)CMP kinase [Candidatus Cloacimonadota bacterium]HPM00625.1 (d)CMP kinase [Candidatus Cloacimonadota bacterium]